MMFRRMLSADFLEGCWPGAGGGAEGGGWVAPLEQGAGEEAATVLDLPRECLRAVLRRLPDPASLIAASEALDELIVNENALWQVPSLISSLF